MPDGFYDAFLSYRHAEPDATLARSLHTLIESYSLPARVARALGRPRRLRAFLDDLEVAGASSLTAELTNRLRAARSLVVLCTPRVKESQWVAWEIEAFRELAPTRVFTVLLEGEPGPSIPTSLFDPTAPTKQALFIDLRKRGAARRAEFLRLIASLHGCDFDELARRDLTRRRRAWVSMSLAGIVLAGTIVVYERRTQGVVAESRNEAARVVVEQSKSELATVESIADSRATMDVGGLVRQLGRQRFSTKGGLGFQRKRLDGDLASDLGKAAEALECYVASLAELDALVAAQGPTPDLLRERAVAIDRQADALLAMGRLAAARTAYEAGIVAARQLVAGDPANRRALSFLLVGRGDVACDEGRATAAMEDYDEAARIRIELARVGGDEDEIDVATVEVKCGDARSLAGRLVDALGFYAAARDRLATLQTHLGRDKRVVSLLGVARQRVGHALLDSGQVREALQEFQQASRDLAVASQRDEENMVVLQLAADSHRWISDAWVSQGRLADAATECETAVAAMQRLSDADPDMVAWRVAAARSAVNCAYVKDRQGDTASAIEVLRAQLVRLGNDDGNQDGIDSMDARADVLRALGQLLATSGAVPAAVDCSRQALAVRDRIAKATGAASDRIRLGDAHHALAHTLDLARQLREALDHQRRAVELLDGETSPGSPDPAWWIHRRVHAYKNLSRLLARTGSHRLAVEWATKAVRAAEALVAIGPNHQMWKRALANSLETLGVLTTNETEWRVAEGALGRACAIGLEISGLDPSDRAWRHTLAWWTMELGDVYWEIPDRPKAIARYEDSLAMCRALCEAAPSEARYADACARNLRWLGELHLENGEPELALPLLQEGTSIHRRLLEREPDREAWRTAAAITRGVEGVAWFGLGRLTDSWIALREAMSGLGNRVLQDEDDNVSAIAVLAALGSRLEDADAAQAAHEAAMQWLGRWMRLREAKLLEYRRRTPQPEPQVRALCAGVRRLRDLDAFRPLRADDRFAGIFAFVDVP